MALWDHLNSDALKMGLIGLVTILFHYFFIRRRMAYEETRLPLGSCEGPPPNDDM